MEDRYVPFADIRAVYCETPHRRVFDLRPDGVAEVSQFGRLSYISARPDIPLHRHFGSFEIHYLVRGGQYWVLGDQTYHMEGGDLFVTLPDEEHSSGGHPSAPGVMYWFVLSLPPERRGMLGLPVKESRAILDRMLNIPGRHFRATNRVKPLLAEVLQLHYRPEAFLRTVCLRQSMIQILLEVIKAAESHGVPQISDRIAGIMRMIRNDPSRQFHLRDLARQAHLSLSRFKGKFKTEVGLSPWLFIVETRIDAAKIRLTAGGEPITEIARQLGFATSQHFSTVFKRITGVTPLAYRKGAFPHGPTRRDYDGQV
jgi:AraC-like DNA-binding protein